MSAKHINVNGHRFHYDDSLYYQVSTENGDRHFREGDMIGQVLGGESPQFAPVLNCEIGDHIPKDAIVIRRFAQPARNASPSSAQALLWILMGFALWAVVSQAIDWAMGG